MKLSLILTTLGILTSGLFAQAQVHLAVVKVQNLSTFAKVLNVTEGNAQVSDVKNGTRDVVVTFKGCFATSAKDLMIVQSGTENDVKYTLVEKNNPMKAHVNCITTITSKVRLQSLVSPSTLGTLHL